jgi:hypothetical protein
MLDGRRKDAKESVIDVFPDETEKALLEREAGEQVLYHT